MRYHVPAVPGGRLAFAFAFGHIRALIQTVDAEG
jgi:hypothetical protein